MNPRIASCFPHKKGLAQLLNSPRVEHAAQLVRRNNRWNRRGCLLYAYLMPPGGFLTFQDYSSISCPELSCGRLRSVPTQMIMRAPPGSLRDEIAVFHKFGQIPVRCVVADVDQFAIRLIGDGIHRPGFHQL